LITTQLREGLKKWLAGVGILHLAALGLLLRITAYIVLPPSDYVLYSDSGLYMYYGRAILSGAKTSVVGVMPIYPVIIALMGDYEYIRALDILISTATIVVAYKLADAVFASRSVAMLSALITAAYPLLIFFSLKAMTEPLYIFLLLLSMLFFYEKRISAGSVCMALSLLVRSLLSLLAPLIVFVFSYVTHRCSLKQSLANTIRYLAVYVVLLAPWWTYHYVVHGYFAGAQENAGAMVFLGTISVGGTFETTPEPRQLREFLEDHEKAQTDPLERDRALFIRALGSIRENPGNYGRLLALKLVYFWKPWPTGALRKYTIFVLMSYGPVLLFFFIFLIRDFGRQWKSVLPMVMIVAYFALMHVILIAGTRYRQPIEPFLIILASYSVIDISRRFRAGRCIEDIAAERMKATG